MTICSDLATKLAEAEAAKHELMLGTQTVMQRQADKQLQVTASDPAKLDAYIRQLKAEMQRRRCPGCAKSRIAIRTRSIDSNPQH